MQALIKDAVDSSRVEVTESIQYAIQNSRISFICVGTPSMPNGSQDLDSLKRSEIAVYLHKIVKK